MTRELIEITFGNAVTQANQIDSCADTLEQLSRSNLAGINNEILAAWQGEAANAYIGKVELTAENIQVTARKLREIARTLRKIAQIFRTTELKALEIAEQRTYGNS